MTQKKQILVVEDNVELAEMLQAYFLGEGYQVRVAGRGADAFTMVEQFLPDIITLDINLPDIDGYELCRRLRQIRPARHIPVIFLTEKRERADKLEGLELGAVDYITKPFDVLELGLRVRNWLRRSQLRTLENPATGLPEWPIVDERLTEMHKQPDWGIVIAGVGGLNKFRDRYGFVAADDVVRAISLIINNAMVAAGVEDAFIGHVGPADFAIITSPMQIAELAKNCLIRLETSIPYYYPDYDHENLASKLTNDRLTARVASLSSADSEFTTIEELRSAASTYY